jgi:hypothetical protein
MGIDITHLAISIMEHRTVCNEDEADADGDGSDSDA